MINVIFTWLLEKTFVLAQWFSCWLWKRFVTRKGFAAGSVLYVRTLETDAGQAGSVRQPSDGVADLINSEIRTFRKAVGLGYVWVGCQGKDFVLFLERRKDARAEVTLTSLLAFGIMLQSKAREARIPLAMALHEEKDAEMRSVGGKPFIAGGGLKDAQRLVSLADGQHFLLWKGARDELSDLIGKETEDMTRRTSPMLGQLFGRLPPRLRKLVERELPPSWDQMVVHLDKFTFYNSHERSSHELLNLYIAVEGKAFIGRAAQPHERFSIEYRDSEVFRQRLVQADEVCIIGLTHESTAEHLHRALADRVKEGKGFWRRLTVVFPSRDVLAGIQEEHRTPERRQSWADKGRLEILRFLQGRASKCADRFECLEYGDALPFVGNRFISAEGASIRVAHILPGADQKRTFYVESFRGTRTYEQLDAAFAVICAKSVHIMEWDIYGKGDPQNGSFQMQGIVRRLQASKFTDWCVPTVLIILHRKVDGRHKVLLQLRDFYNASDKFGTYSNISGVLTDNDIYRHEGKMSPVTYADGEPWRATQELFAITGLKEGHVLPEDVWRQAAVREIREELGIDILKDRLVRHCSVCLGGGNCQNCTPKIFFVIYSLELNGGPARNEYENARQPNAKTDRSEYQNILKWRPHAGLHHFSLSELGEFRRKEKCNRLLQTRFSLFKDIFKKLEISP